MSVAIVLSGIDPPRDVGQMSVVVRRIAGLLGPDVVKASISTKTECPLDALPERAEAARAALISRLRRRRMRRTIPMDLRNPTDLDLFVQWAPWSADARVGTGRRDVRLSLSSSGRSFWANLDPAALADLGDWLRSKALGHLVDIDKWARAQKQKQAR